MFICVQYFEIFWSIVESHLILVVYVCIVVKYPVWVCAISDGDKLVDSGLFFGVCYSLVQTPVTIIMEIVGWWQFLWTLITRLAT